jgi:hypothetical protein
MYACMHVHLSYFSLLGLYIFKHTPLHVVLLLELIYSGTVGADERQVDCLAGYRASTLSQIFHLLSFQMKLEPFIFKGAQVKSQQGRGQSKGLHATTLE